MKSRATAFLLFAILLSGVALAQEPTVISGQVTSATDGSPLSGASVIAPASASRPQRTRRGATP